MGVLPNVRGLNITDWVENTVILMDLERWLLKPIARMMAYFYHITQSGQEPALAWNTQSEGVRYLFRSFSVSFLISLANFNTADSFG
jgi:hypothetical protein